MAEDRLFDPNTLREAREGFQEFSRRLEDLAGDAEDRGRSMVRFLRTIPAADEKKKEELADFFRSDVGQRYNKFARRMLYDELLGPDRNKENRG